MLRRPDDGMGVGGRWLIAPGPIGGIGAGFAAGLAGLAAAFAGFFVVFDVVGCAGAGAGAAPAASGAAIRNAAINERTVRFDITSPP